MAEPVTLDLLDTAVTATVLVTVQVKVAEPAEPPPSVAVIVTVETPGADGVPVTEPVVELMDRPVGRPEAVQVRVWPVVVSVALLERAVMADPVTLDLLPGLVTATVPVIVQVKLAVAL